MDQMDVERALHTIGLKVQNDESLLGNTYSKEDISLLESIGTKLYDVGDYPTSIQVFKQLILAHPMQSKYWFSLAAALQESKNFDQAISAWNMAAVFDEKNPYPLFHAGECHLSVKRVTLAREAFDEAKSRCSDSAEEQKLHDKMHEMLKAWEATDGVLSYN